MLNQFDFGISADHQQQMARPKRPTGSNLFLALRPDRRAALRARGLGIDMRDMYRASRQPHTEERLHVSLINLGLTGDLDESAVWHARQAIGGTVFSPFEIRFDRIIGLNNGASQPIVLCGKERNSSLDKLVGRLVYALQGLGVPCHFNEKFLPHMTLLYHHAAIAEMRLDEPIAWTVDRVWLIHSLVGQTKYEFLWPLEA